MTETGIDAVRRWMESHRNDIIEDMRRIVNIRSVSEPDSDVLPFGKGCRKVLDTMLELAAGKGFKTDCFNYYGGKISFASGSGKEIGIWSHLDVVPEGNGWTYPPYEMTVVDDFLIGRGVQDNKSSAVGILYVLLYLKEFVSLNCNYSLYVGCSEENTMDDAAYMIAHVPMPEVSLVADCGFPVCHGEKGNLSLVFETRELLPETVISVEGGSSANSIPDQARIVYRSGVVTKEQKERLRLSPEITVMDGEYGTVVEASGRAAHIISPEQGKSAVTILAKELMACGLNERSAGENQWIEFLRDCGRDGYGTGIGAAVSDTVSGCLVGGITGLAVTSGSERRLKITADYRYPVLDSRGACSDGSETLEKMREAARRYGLRLCVRKNSGAMYCPADNPVVQCLTDSYHKYSGYDNPAYTMSGGTYARKLPGGLGFGMALPEKKVYRPDPARPVGDFHQADESICISQLLEAMAIYTMCLIDLDRHI